MDPFNGNKNFENAVFTAMDYAFYSRHDIDGMLAPFIMNFNKNEFGLTRVIPENNPETAILNVLKENDIAGDYLAYAIEGRMEHNGKKVDAIFVKAFDTSKETGIMFAQKFRGLESGKPFTKIGNPALVSLDEPLPVEKKKRKKDKQLEDPYVAALVVKGDKGLTYRQIMVMCDQLPLAAPQITNLILEAVSKNESDFSGEFRLKFHPNSIENNPFTQFQIHQLFDDIQLFDEVKNWEKQKGRKILLGECTIDDKPIPLRKSNQQGNSGSSNSKPWWQFWN